MTKIKHYAERIDEELEDAKYYAEQSIECKSAGDSSMAGKYKTIAEDELRHAMTIHDQAVKEIENIKKVYQAPSWMEEKWNNVHTMYVERTAFIKTMLNM